MADIRSYMKEREKRERKQAGYKEKIMRHKLTALYRILLVLVAALALVALISIQYKRHVYTGYDVLSSVRREDVPGATDRRLGSAVLTYSKDGAHCTDMGGNVTWNRTFEIQDILCAICGDTAAIGGYNSKSIYVQNAEKQLSEITTTMPIRDLAVSSSGYVAAVLEEGDTSMIKIYRPDGKLAYEGEVHMTTSGYPAAVSLSPNGELMCIAHWYLDAGELKTKIAFLNFGSVGENYTDYIVSGFTYTDMLVPQVQFMNNNTAFAVGDSRLMIYAGSHVPDVRAERVLSGKIKSVFYSEQYIGLVFWADDGQNLYCLEVYDTNAEKVGSFFLNMEYSDIFFGRDNFVAYNETECVIMTLDGIEKFNGEFSKAVRLMAPINNTYKYLLVTDSSIDTIQLK